MVDPVTPEVCPSCEGPVDPGQEYCLECGERLEGARRRPHWLWPSLACLAVAAAGAAGAIAARAGGGGEKTIVALSPLVPAPAEAPGTEAAGRPGGRALIPWPGRHAYTVVLAAVPTRRGQGEARAQALRALRAGLPEVGILVSARYPGLHPGYYLVFSGVYDTLEEANSHLPKAASRFPSAYAREIAP